MATTTLYATMGARPWAYHPDTAYNYDYQTAGENSGGYAYESFVMFDISSLCGVINSATLILTQFDSDDDWLVPTVTWEAFVPCLTSNPSATNIWNSSTTWNSRPTGRASASAYCTFNNAISTGIRFNVTDILQDVVDGLIVWNGFRIRYTGTSSSTAKYFRSPTYSTTSARPKLVIDYTPIPDPPGTVSAIGDISSTYAEQHITYSWQTFYNPGVIVRSRCYYSNGTLFSTSTTTVTEQDPQQRSIDISSAARGSTFYIVIDATYNQTQYSTASTTNTVTRNYQPTTPSAPVLANSNADGSVTNSTAEAESYVNVTWNACTDAGGGTLSYRLYRKVGSGSYTQIYSGTACSYIDNVSSDTNFPRGSTIYYYVVATDGYVSSANGSVATILRNSLPEIPAPTFTTTGNPAYSIISDTYNYIHPGNNVTIAWDAPTDAATYTLTQYFYNGSTTTSTTPIQNQNTRTYNLPVSNLTDGQYYYVTIVAIDALGAVSSTYTSTRFYREPVLAAPTISSIGSYTGISPYKIFRNTSYVITWSQSATNLSSHNNLQYKIEVVDQTEQSPLSPYAIRNYASASTLSYSYDFSNLPSSWQGRQVKVKIYTMHGVWGDVTSVTSTDTYIVDTRAAATSPVAINRTGSTYERYRQNLSWTASTCSGVTNMYYQIKIWVDGTPTTITSVQTGTSKTDYYLPYVSTNTLAYFTIQAIPDDEAGGCIPGTSTHASYLDSPIVASSQFTIVNRTLPTHTISFANRGVSQSGNDEINSVTVNVAWNVAGGYIMSNYVAGNPNHGVRWRLKWRINGTTTYYNPTSYIGLTAVNGYIETVPTSSPVTFTITDTGGTNGYKTQQLDIIMEVEYTYLLQDDGITWESISSTITSGTAVNTPLTIPAASVPINITRYGLGINTTVADDSYVCKVAGNMQLIGADIYDDNGQRKYQPYGNELAALQNLADTAGFVKKTSDGAYSIDTTTYISTSALSSLMLAMYPVGSIYISVSSTSPAVLFGGVWSAFGAGRVLVGYDSGDSDFNTAEKIGGEKTHTLTTAEMPSHTHTQNAHTHTQDAHTHGPGTLAGYYKMRDTDDSGTAVWGSEAFLYSAFDTNSTAGAVVINSGTTASATATNQSATATNQSATATNQSAGGGDAHNNLQPYITVYMWKRTA